MVTGLNECKADTVPVNRKRDGLDVQPRPDHQELWSPDSQQTPVMFGRRMKIAAVIIAAILLVSQIIYLFMDGQVYPPAVQEQMNRR